MAPKNNSKPKENKPKPLASVAPEAPKEKKPRIKKTFGEKVGGLLEPKRKEVAKLKSRRDKLFTAYQKTLSMLANSESDLAELEKALGTLAQKEEAAQLEGEDASAPLPIVDASEEAAE